MSTVKSKNLQVGTDATATNNFTIYQPATPDGTLRIGVGNADSPTEVAQFTSAGMVSGATSLTTATGSAPSYSARAWCKLSADVIQAAGNISSVTDNGTGNYTINFATAMPDADYAIGSSTTRTESDTGEAAAGGIAVRQYTTTSFRVLFYQGTSGGFYDPTTSSFIITR